MPKRRERIQKAIKDVLIEYFQKTSLNGFGLLYHIRRRKYQRICWTMFISIGIGYSFYIVCFVLILFLSEPTVTTLGTKHYRNQLIPFPAVSVCSVNKLSRQAVHGYAMELSKRTALNHSLDYWTKKIILFAGYFDTSILDFDEAIEFQNQLNKQIPEQAFNSTSFLRGLAPLCSNLFIKCEILGRFQNCNDLFSLETTVAGNCCVFNYRRISSHRRIMYSSGTSVDLGLTFLLNASIDDYFYADRNVHGYVIQVFNPKNFPDLSTGGVQEVFISPGEDVELQLAITSQTSSGDIAVYPVKARHCYMDGENFAEYGSTYSSSECLTRCKLRSVLNLCGCWPYYTPVDLIDQNSNISYCSLIHLECLERNRVAWSTYKFKGDLPIPMDLLSQLQESLECENCLPLCSYILYLFRSQKRKLWSTQFTKENKIFMDHNNVLLPNTSLVKIYFPNLNAVHYKKDVLYKWYEILSTIGGVIGICIGCSLISGFEIIYFFIYRFCVKYYNYGRNNVS